MPSKNLKWTKEWMWEYVVRVTSCVYDFSSFVSHFAEICIVT